MLERRWTAHLAMPGLPAVRLGQGYMSSTFASVLVAAMHRHGSSIAETARLVGVDKCSIRNWRYGHSRPLHELAVRLADVLDTPGLAEISVAIRSKRCALCGTCFLDSSKRVQRLYCGAMCMRSAHSSRQREREHGRREDHSRLLRNRLDVLQDAVDAFCRSCEPEGLCRDAACPLRSASPLPLYKAKSA